MTDQSVIMATATSAPDKKRTILDAARRLLVEHGYQDVTMDDVAQKAGVAKGTLFLYYRSKEQLLSAAMCDLAEQLGESLEKLAAEDRRGRELLDETVSVIVGFFEGNSDFMAQTSLGRIPGCGHRCNAKLMERFSANLKRVSALLKRCARDGVLRGEDLDLSASFLFSLCRTAAMYQLLTGRDLGPQARRQKVVDFFLTGAGR